jgi:hypothetical protein
MDGRRRWLAKNDRRSSSSDGLPKRSVGRTAYLPQSVSQNLERDRQFQIYINSEQTTSIGRL